MRAALLRLLVHRPFHDLTVKEIAVEAGLGLATFYRHYPTKAALLDIIADKEIDTFVAMAVGLAQAANPHDSSLALIRYVSDHRAIWTVLLSGGAAGTMHAGFMRRLGEAFPPSRSEWPRAVPAELCIQLSVGATLDIITWWIRQPDILPSSRIADLLERFAIRPYLGLGPASPAPLDEPETGAGDTADRDRPAP